MTVNKVNVILVLRELNRKPEVSSPRSATGALTTRTKAREQKQEPVSSSSERHKHVSRSNPEHLHSPS